VNDAAALVDAVRTGSRRAIGRAITAVENGGDSGRAVLAAVSAHAGDAIRLGITGPPGVGKSTLISSLVAARRAAGQTVAVVSVDPTSPFSNGAVLGDRIRLVEHFTDPGVFIRSMASRGQLGGVSLGTASAMTVLEAAGFDIVIVETVGAGQNEVEIRSITDTVALVLMPGSGDGVQALKAGVMEIPDVLVINKADHPATPQLRAELRAAMRLIPHDGWQVPVCETRANTGAGIDDLWDAVLAHRDALGDEGLRERRADGMRSRLRSMALDRLGRRLDAACPAPLLDELASQVVGGGTAPDVAVDRMLARFARGDDRGALSDR
jgi:LAO/AO transport system kinase